MRLGRGFAAVMVPLGLAMALPFAFLATPATARPAAEAKVPDAAAPVGKPIKAKPGLWVVKDADTTIYLFGSMHVLKPEVQWFGGQIKQAFDSSDALVLEMIEPEPADMQKLVAAMAVNPDGPPLTSKLTEEQRAAYIAAMNRIKLPWQALETLDPWLVAVTMSVAPLEGLGYKSDAGVEKVLTQAAKAEGKQIEGLETPAQQLGYFDGLPEEQQIAFLNATVSELPGMEKEFDGMLKAWSKGQTDTLGRQMNESLTATPELAKVLLVDRNARWADWIKARLERPGTVFIAVGAGHLAGDNSVQAQLQAMGIASTRLRGR